MTPSERLREAARVLREPWTVRAPWWCSSDLATPLADWLEKLAAEAEVLESILPPHPGTPTHPAMRVADAVLGEP